MGLLLSMRNYYYDNNNSNNKGFLARNKNPLGNGRRGHYLSIGAVA